MLFLDELEVRALAAHALGQAAHAAPGNEVAADELQEARELRVAGGRGDRAVELEVLVDRALAALGGAVERLERRADGAHLRLGRALGGEPGGLDLHAQ